MVGSPAILGSYRRTPVRKRGPVALRPKLWSGLPFSQIGLSAQGDRCQFWDLPKAGGFDIV